ncbi:MAG: hypothetical protein K2G97_03030, partial [Oscillospiraceae bacterium]|nr:hypothetical protein [Oscillospiraceae bacterium]
MKLKRILSVILTMSIIATSFSSVIQISAQTEKSSSTAAQFTAVEDGSMQTASVPSEPTKEFIISSEDNFELFMTTSEFWEANYKVKLVCDIDMKWKAFKSIKEFGGVFDGCGHTISNFKIQNKSDKDKNVELAFIKTLNENAEIKNIKFDNYTIETRSMKDKPKLIKIGMVAVTIHGIVSNVNIINGSIDNIYEKSNAAGFVLNNEGDGVIENCHIEGIGTIDSDIGSGFIGTNLGRITNCSTTLSVNSEDIAGGFVEVNDGEINNCKSEGSVTINSKSKNSTLLSGNILTICGGFAGINSDNGKINSCQTTCNVESNTKAGIALCGGFLGLNLGKIKDCIGKGKVYGYSSYTICKGLGTITVICLDVLLGTAFIFGLMMYFCDGSELFIGCSWLVVNIASYISLYSLESIKIKYNYINVGGFCGSNTGEISGSRFEGSAIANAKEFETKCGGFVGDNDKQGKISNCISTGSAIGQEYVGGFCGNNSGEISKSNSEGNATAKTISHTNRCGDFVGENEGIVKDSNAKGSATGEEYVGGFAGVNKSEIVDCNARCKATAKTKIHTALAGGFVGENENGKITNCTAKGGADSRSSSGQAKAGGFVGINKASIMDSKASGNVYLSAGTCHKDDGCGGFVGKNDQGGSIEGCYAEATVETTNKKKGGGFVGEAKSKSTIKNSQCKTKIVTKSGTKNNTKF